MQQLAILACGLPALVCLPAAPAFAQTSPGQASRPAQTVRVGNLANIPELNRYLRRVRDGCGTEPRIVTESRPSEKPPGDIIGQHPPRGTRVGCDATSVILYVSSGPAQPQPYVPALVEPRHRTIFEQQASEVCKAPVRIAVQKQASDLPAGMFLSQYPPQGGRYRCGTSIQVTVSAGHEKPPAPEKAKPKPVRLPVVEQERLPASAKGAPVPPVPMPETPAVPENGPPPAAIETAPAPPEQGPALLPPAVVQPEQGRSAPWLLVAAIGLAALALGLLVAAFRRMRSPAKPQKPASLPPVASASGEPVAAPGATAPMALAIGRPMTAAALGQPMPPDAHAHSAAGAVLKPDAILADIVRPIDSVVDWIAGTSVAEASAAALGQRGQRLGGGGETLAPLRNDIAEGFAQALLFELGPLVADAMARARDLPFSDGGKGAAGNGSTSRCPLDPHSIAITVYPDFNVTAAGLGLFRIAPYLELRLGFDSAAALIRGHSLEGLEPGSVTASARVSWLGESRPVQIAARHLDWKGPVPISPPRLLQALSDSPQGAK